jgi:predicted regulator of Ras-like GTPase activity (Roadblock/LC7/MglB family)
VPNEEPVKKPEKKKKKGELIAETLQKLLQQSTDVQGAAIVGNDGLVYSANVPEKELDENIVGAASAAILGLSRRSVNQLKRGGFSQTLIQGDNGNIIVTRLSDETLFVGLTPKEVNLGMAFAEVRDFASKLSGIV